MSYNAYGDESAGANFVAYGTLLLPSDDVEAVEAEIARLKVEYGAAVTDRLHCRVLFSGDARRKSAWSKLTMDDVFGLYSKLVDVVRPRTTRVIVTLANKAELPSQIPGGQWEPASDSSVGPTNWSPGWTFQNKQIASLCGQGTMIPISKWPGFKCVTFWPDPDSSLIEFAGGRRQFGQMLSGFIDHQDGNEPERIAVSYAESGKPAMIEVADLVAYVTQRSAGAKYTPVDLKFKALDKAIQAEKLRLGVTPQGGIGFDIPTALLQRRS